MNREEFGHWMSEMTDVLTNVSGKLNQVADLNLALGKKLDRLAEQSTENDQRLGERFEALASLSTQTEQKIDRLADKIDKLADASTASNGKMDRLVDALLQREGRVR